MPCYPYILVYRCCAHGEPDAAPLAQKSESMSMEPIAQRVHKQPEKRPEGNHATTTTTTSTWCLIWCPTNHTKRKRRMMTETLATERCEGKMTVIDSPIRSIRSAELSVVSGNGGSWQTVTCRQIGPLAPILTNSDHPPRIICDFAGGVATSVSSPFFRGRQKCDTCPAVKAIYTRGGAKQPRQRMKTSFWVILANCPL